jgi:hypothetical protein
VARENNDLGGLDVTIVVSRCHVLLGSVISVRSSSSRSWGSYASR